MAQEEEKTAQYIINLHSELPECPCEEYIKAKVKYVRIIDMDRFVDNLNDWD